jgi:SAM-dependent methyltransferase
MNTREEILAYWRDPGVQNQPSHYLPNQVNSQRSAFLVKLCQEIRLEPRHTILELGCNAGRNLLHLWQAGYQNLYGIEINKAAVQLMRQTFPELSARIRIGTIEDLLPVSPVFHLIFTVAVLVHIHPDSDWIFAEMAKKTRNYLITIEDEVTYKSSRHVARNYQGIFESLGMKQIIFRESVPGMNVAYKARVFIK